MWSSVPTQDPEELIYLLGRLRMVRYTAVKRRVNVESERPCCFIDNRSSNLYKAFHYVVPHSDPN
jgi:hypothetical protein